MISNKIVLEDLDYIKNKLGDSANRRFDGATILITGCAGFLGYYFVKYFTYYAEELGIKKIIGLDNFLLEQPKWLEKLAEKSDRLEVKKFDVIKDKISELEGAEEANFIIHMASIASPVFYRKYPLITIDANIWGLRQLLDFYCNKDIDGLLFFSSSEIYGDPPADKIPTSEDYRGNVACTGPRACYDESKRFGETLCEVFTQEYDMPISIARPFNNFGPGMRLGDKRVPADFAKAVFENKDIEIFSDGSPTRTFCYISDAITGYLKVLLHGKFDAFNIGIEKPEINIRSLAELYQQAGKEILGSCGKVKLSPPPEANYLTDNPNRRCPVIDKARTILGYNPEIEVEQGVRRFLEFIKINNGEL